MTFPPLENSDHVFVSVSIDFLSNSKRDAPFYCSPFPHFRDGFPDHLRDVRWRISLNSVFLLLLVSFVNGFSSELMYISLFSAACAAVIAHRNQSIIDICLDRLAIIAKADKLAYANKTRVYYYFPSFSRGFW